MTDNNDDDDDDTMYLHGNLIGTDKDGQQRHTMYLRGNLIGTDDTNDNDRQHPLNHSYSMILFPDIFL